jgi:uroporphyrin-III C-methyltransferase
MTEHEGARRFDGLDAGDAGPRSETAAPDWAALMPEFRRGTVWLTGAGPGDPGLLTLQALHALRHADIVYFDALVSPEVLALAGTGAREFVGKRAGSPSLEQAEITARLIASARAGLRVLRLKGGDPFVFGRGAEEAMGLAEAGIRFRIVPGVTSGIGGLAYAGLPVTHRDVNQAVAFVTAHDASGGLPESLDWPAIARAAPVLVIYMGFRLMREICERLAAAGLAPGTPAAAVSKATRADQRVVCSTLARLADDAGAAGLEPPVLVVVGAIVGLRPMLNWLEHAALAAEDDAPERRMAGGRARGHR